MAVERKTNLMSILLSCIMHSNIVINSNNMKNKKLSISFFDIPWWGDFMYIILIQTSESGLTTQLLSIKSSSYTRTHT